MIGFGIRVQVGMKGGSQKIEKIFQRHEIRIGRGLTNDVILNRSNVSRFHCRAISINGMIFIIDSGSTNGTYINESRAVGWLPIRASDEVVIGDYVLTLTAESVTNREASSGSSERERASEEKKKTQSRQKSHKARAQNNAGRSSRKKQERSSQTKSPWDVLGIPKGTPKAEAKKSYLKLLSLYHPDKVDSLGPKIKEVAIEMTKELNEAWAKIESNQA
jgi:pSer/pThr/pTyr-binding forkhead associated (FHA) protein